MLSQNEVRIKAQARNNRLYALIKSKWVRCGKPNVAAFCRELEIDQSLVGRLLNLKEMPFYQEGKYIGQYLSVAQKIADYFNVPVETLFPFDLYQRVINPTVSRDFSLKELPYLHNMMLSFDQNQPEESLMENLPLISRR